MLLRRFIPPGHSISLAGLVIGLFCFACPPCFAQATTGNLVGQVRNQAGVALAEVKVLAINARNGHKSATRTNSNGGFIIPDLTPGAYHVIASKDGFQSVCLPGLQIFLNRNNSVKYPPNIKLPAGGGKSDHPACPGLKIAAVTQGDGKSNVAPVGLSADDQVSEPGFIGANYPRGGPRALGAFLLITLERDETGDQSGSGSAQNNNNNQNPPSTQTSQESDAIGLVNTIDAARGMNFTEKQIESLPLGAASYMRNFDELLLLAPGVAPPPYTPGVRGPGVGFGIGTAGQFSVNGARARANNFSVDGSDTNDPDVGVRRGGYVAQTPQSLASIQEVSISTLLWIADIGRNSGSQVNAVSKYGGNEYHGQAYGFFTDSRLNARNFFDYTGGASRGKDPLTRTQAGVVIGGPVVRDRTQFFGSFEGAKVNASTEQHFASPTLGERRFGFIESNFFGAIALTGPATRVYLNPFPEPKSPGGPYGHNTYTEVLPADGEGFIYSARLTHRLAERHTLNTRYGFTDDRRVLPSVNRAIYSTIGADARSQGLSLTIDSQAATRLFNQARFSFGRTRVDFPEHPLAPFGRLNLNDHGSSGCTIYTDGTGTCLSGGLSSQNRTIGEITIEPFSPVGVNALLFPQGRVNNTYQYADALSWHWREHSFKFGGALRRVQLNSFQDRLYRPQVSFGYGLGEPGSLDVQVENNKFVHRFTTQGGLVALSGLGLALLLPTSALQTLTAGAPDSHIGLRISERHFFFDDNWRVRSNLTLNYGLRYEYNTVPREAHNRIEDALALRNLPTPDATTIPSARAKYEGLINAYRGVLGDRTGIYDPDRNNFGPRLGLAWDPRSDGKMALRAGYGIYYDAILGAVVSQSRNVFPNEIPVGVDRPEPGGPVVPSTCDTVVCEPGKTLPVSYIKSNQLKGGPGAFVSNIVTLSDKIRAGLAFALPAKNLPAPYTQQWHLTFEREARGDLLLAIGYVGTKGAKLTRLITPNGGPTSTPFSKIVTKRTPAWPDNWNGWGDPTRHGFLYDSVSLILLGSRPVPELGAYQIFENSAGSSYHGLQLEASRRYSPSFNFTVAYTWSHAIDDVSDLFPISGAPIVAQSQNDLAADRGNASFDVRHRFAFSSVWDLPFSKSKAARWRGGWQLASIFQAQTGQPFTLSLPIDANLDGNVTDRPSTTQGLIFLEGHGRQKVALAQGAKLDNFFVLSRNGMVGRNTVRGDSFVNLDLALTKTFRFTDQKNLAFRAELFNLFNRANFGLPIRTLDAPSFGSAVETVNPARVIQIALKYNF